MMGNLPGRGVAFAVAHIVDDGDASNCFLANATVAAACSGEGLKSSSVAAKIQVITIGEMTCSALRSGVPDQSLNGPRDFPLCGLSRFINLASVAARVIVLKNDPETYGIFPWGVGKSEVGRVAVYNP
jgi:hypothetical protein